EIRSQPSGVGFNIARALSTLGNRVRFVSMVGSDFLGTALRQSMTGFGVSDEFILTVLDETPQSIVIFDGAGRRMVNTDLKDMGERVYSTQLFTRALQECRAAVMTNVGEQRTEWSDNPRRQRIGAFGSPHIRSLEGIMTDRVR